jgi:hypothetical protein
MAIYAIKDFPVDAGLPSGMRGGEIHPIRSANGCRRGTFVFPASLQISGSWSEVWCLPPLPVAGKTGRRDRHIAHNTPPAPPPHPH